MASLSDKKINSFCFSEINSFNKDRLSCLIIIFFALLGLLFLSIVEPSYLRFQGFPLDDAWIHAVYGREFARSGILAYNPGIPATGCTSPLWAIFLAIPHLASSSPDITVFLIKIMGFLFHLLTSLTIYFAFRRSDKTSSIFGAALVAIQPELIAASVSGMEIPLATFMSSILILSIQKNPLLFAFSSALVCISRPELMVLALLLPILLFPFSRPKLISYSFAGIAGSVFSWSLMMLRNWRISGLPFPATYYAKVNSSIWSSFKSFYVGFSQLFPEIAIVNSWLIMVGALIISLFFLHSRHSLSEHRMASSFFICGLVYCLVSFYLIPPVDPKAFYHQRYIFPGLPLLIAPLPVIVASYFRPKLSPTIKKIIFFIFIFLALLTIIIHAPKRFRHLANDTRNIDDVQVAIGLFLSRTSPTDTVWVVDAGASRYFGRAFVVDLMGLNNFQLLTKEANYFLNSHPPSFIEVVPGWNEIDENFVKNLRYKLFKPSTSYTVTSFQPMQYHFLFFSTEKKHKGKIMFKGKSFDFELKPPKLVK